MRSALELHAQMVQGVGKVCRPVLVVLEVECSHVDPVIEVDGHLYRLPAQLPFQTSAQIPIAPSSKGHAPIDIVLGELGQSKVPTLEGLDEPSF